MTAELGAELKFVADWSIDSSGLLEVYPAFVSDDEGSSGSPRPAAARR